jgi:transposase
MHKLQELVRLHRQGRSARDIARLLQMSRNTVRTYISTLDASGLLTGPVDLLPELAVLRAALPGRRPPQEVSSVVDWLPQVRELVARGASPGAIHDFLRTNDADFHGSLPAVKRLVARCRRDLGPRAADVVLPVVSSPGEIAQVDFKYAEYLHNPAKDAPCRAWIFIMVLAHSRHMFAKVVFDQRADTWQQLHVEAFAFFGGVPRVIVPDNLKAAVIKAAFGTGDDPQLHRGYCELARHYGFTIDPTPPRSPEKKGKVEAGAKYVGLNFLRTLPDGLDLVEANRRLERWVLEVAGRRTHGTTHKQPLKTFEEEERGTLLPLPAQRYRITVWRAARVHRDAHVQFDRRFYSVPFRFIGATVHLRATPDRVQFYVEDETVAVHDRSGPGQFSTFDEHLPVERVAQRQRNAAFWLARAAHLGPEVEGLAHEIVSLGGAINPIRQVMAIVGLLERHPSDRANNVARRARHFGSRRYREIAEMLRKGLDFEPLPPELPLAPVPPNPRFARDLHSLLTA